MKVRFITPANIELDEAARYYDHEMPGLGFRFFQEVDAAIERIRLFPEGWTRIGRRTRRCMLKGFPYALLYTIEDDEILVSAVAHLHRDPKHYEDRIQTPLGDKIDKSLSICIDIVGRADSPAILTGRLPVLPLAALTGHFIPAHSGI